jgi:hypothetical protein
MLAALGDIKDHYVTDAAVAAVGLDQFSGCFNFRGKRGDPSSLSMHAYACATDLDAAHNPFRSKAGRMPSAALAAFKKQGAEWGGLWSLNRACRHHRDRPSLPAACACGRDRRRRAMVTAGPQLRLGFGHVFVGAVAGTFAGTMLFAIIGPAVDATGIDPLDGQLLGANLARTLGINLYAVPADILRAWARKASRKKTHDHIGPAAPAPHVPCLAENGTLQPGRHHRVFQLARRPGREGADGRAAVGAIRRRS